MQYEIYSTPQQIVDHVVHLLQWFLQMLRTENLTIHHCHHGPLVFRYNSIGTAFLRAT